MRVKKWLLLMLFCLGNSMVWANDSLLQQQLLNRLECLQSGRYDNYFKPGIFPTYRQYTANKKSVKKDECIFFTGLIGLTLNACKPYLPTVQQQQCDKMIHQIRQIAPKYINQKGRGTYNFWPTDTPVIFPNAGWLNWFDKTNALADDLDDTAIMLLALQTSSDTVKAIHALMQQFTNSEKTPVHNTLPNYQKIPAYSVWFGKKMLVEFDVCPMMNVLLMVQQYGLPWRSADSAALQMLTTMLENDHHLTHAGELSIYYKKPAIILYHLARLMQVKPIPSLEKYKQKLIKDALALYQKSDNIIEKIMLSTALLKWGFVPPKLVVHLKDGNLLQSVEHAAYSFFIADWVCIMPPKMAAKFTNKAISKFDFYCPAYYDVLLLENVIEWKKASLNHH